MHRFPVCLMYRQYAFSLENRVLTGVQAGYSVPSALHPSAPFNVAATCPPYWMLFSSPQQSRLASRWSSDFWEPNPRRRSHSLNISHFHVINERGKFKMSNIEDDESSDDEEASFTRPKLNHSGLRRQELNVKDLLNLHSRCGHSSEQHSRIQQCSLPNSEAQGKYFWKTQDHGDSFHDHLSMTLGHITPITQVRKRQFQMDLVKCSQIFLIELLIPCQVNTLA